VVLGNNEEKILETANAESVDLVVLAIRKHFLFPHLMAQGKLLKMISKLPCPVLLKLPFFEPWPQFGITTR
jgi:nucleotide-binding universal stress UspA family protein